jgi:hypothetical protein
MEYADLFTGPTCPSGFSDRLSADTEATAFTYSTPPTVKLMNLAYFSVCALNATASDICGSFDMETNVWVTNKLARQSKFEL